MAGSEHHRKLERMYVAAPTNDYYEPTIRIGDGVAEIRIVVRPDFFHAARAVHGSVYFKALDDAAFFAANSLIDDVLVLTTSLNVHLLRPVSQGELTASGEVVSRSRRLLVAESRLRDAQDRLLATATGTFVAGRIELGPDIGYR